LEWNAGLHKWCSSNESWIWSYGAAVKVPEGTVPQLNATLFTTFRKCAFDPFNLCQFVKSNPYDSATVGPIYFAPGLAPHVSFETNPLVGSIVLGGILTSSSSFGSPSGSLPAEFRNGEHSFFPPGKYSLTAVAPDDYVFDHWECPDQYHRECGDPSSITLQVGPGVPDTYPPSKSNPAFVNIQGSGVVKAVFAAKLTFVTYPPYIASFTYDAGGTCIEESSPTYHPSGDWVYVSALPPDNNGPVNNGLVAEYVCVVTPTGYRFDHWSTTARLISTTRTGGVPDVNQATVVLSGPSTIEAWFTPLAPALSSVPSPPNDMVATGQYGHTDLTWGPPVSDGGSPVTGYQIYRGTSFASLSLLTPVSNQLWDQDSSVTDSQIYFYQVTAVNSAGEGSPSNIDSAKPGIDQITVSPDPRSVLTGGKVQFSAVATAESGEVIQGISFSWATSVPSASITSAGTFTAGASTGTFSDEVSASAEGAVGYATVIVQATHGNTVGLSFDSISAWAWTLIPLGAIAAGAIGATKYRRKTKGTITPMASASVRI